MQTTTHARVIRQVRGSATSDGAGVKLTRVIGGQALPELDPFLLLDEFGTDQAEDYIAGFPSHPHRGFETVTYMLDGRMRHKDNHGNEGLLVPGSVQWMTAGRGLVHSEMPEQEEGRMRGFQRSEEHTSELQSLMRSSYAVFCLKKKKKEKGTIHFHKTVTHTHARGTAR